MADIHQHLINLDNEPQKKRSARLPDKPAEDHLEEGWTPGVQMPMPKVAVNQWKLLKMIKQANGLALADVGWLFQLEDRDSDLIQKPLGQLLRAHRIRRMIGASRRTGQVGTFYQAAEEKEI